MESRFFVPNLIVPLSPRDPGENGRRWALASRAGPVHDPELEPRDEAVFLLTAAAEIEHALMVQYLYAAYSVRTVSDDSHGDVKQVVHDPLIQVAREEMGHLVTVQNLLHLVGGPLNLGREHSPYASEIYPFRFKLERVTLDSLAKYVVAESPAFLPADVPDEDKALLERIRQDAARSNDGYEVRHVGPIFERLEDLFAHHLADGDLQLDTLRRQATFADWGYEPRSAAAGEPLIVESFPDTDVGRARAAAAAAVHKIGAQGEGFDLEPAGPGTESHFERFLDLYKRVRELESTGVTVTWPVTENPNTTQAGGQPARTADMVAVVKAAHASKGRITHPRARAWAQLFNLRYRLLLSLLSSPSGCDMTPATTPSNGSRHRVDAVFTVQWRSRLHEVNPGSSPHPWR